MITIAKPENLGQNLLIKVVDNCDNYDDIDKNAVVHYYYSGPNKIHDIISETPSKTMHFCENLYFTLDEISIINFPSLDIKRRYLSRFVERVVLLSARLDADHQLLSNIITFFSRGSERTIQRHNKRSRFYVEGIEDMVGD